MEEAEEAQHPPKTGKACPAGNPPEWGNGKGDHQEPKGPVASRIGDVVDGIRTKTAVEGVPYKQRHRHKTQQKHQRFENPPAVKFRHSQT